MRLLITGGTGFVGRHMMRCAEAKGINVAGLSRGEMDVRDAERVRAVIADVKPTHVVHLASTLPNVPAAEQHYAVNVVGTINLLEAIAAEAPEATVLLSSSSAVYGSGTPSDRPTRETDRLEPLSHYAVSKANEEFVGGYYHRARGVRVIVGRPFNLVGPGLRPGLLATDIARQIVAAEHGAVRQAQGRRDAVVRVGDGDSARDFLDVRDLAEAYLALLERGEAGETYNVCSGRLTPVRECVERLVGMSRVPVAVEAIDRPAARGEVRSQQGDPARLQQATGWRPRIALDESLRDLIDDCRRSYEAGEWV